MGRPRLEQRSNRRHFLLLNRTLIPVSLADVDPAKLLEWKEIQGCEVTVMEAILRIVQHFGLHTGQIMLLTKLRTGEDLKLS